MAYTTIDDPTAFFETTLYTGNGGTNSISSLDFQPDWLWIKCRSAASGSNIFDVLRGTNSLHSDTNGPDADRASDGFTSLDNDGFTLNGSGSGGSINVNSRTYAAMNWKAGGSASANSDGSTASSISANTTAGFSIVSYTGAGATTYGHGLGATPNVIIIKKRTNDSGNNNWFVYHDKVITAGGSNKSFLTLNETDALSANGSATTFTSVSSTTFGVGTDDIISESSHTFIAYCFAEKKGYSKFGSYAANESVDGTFVYTGFKPAFVILKQSNLARDWHMFDNKRSTFNAVGRYLRPNVSGAEDSGEDYLDLLSNGFKLKNTGNRFNDADGTYIFMAFAESPFVTSTGIPTTAR